MQQNQQNFFEAAVELSGSLNSSSLAKKIGVTRGSLSDWKKGRSYPSDKTMLKIAILCDLDPAEALALLNLWRCDESARGTYKAILEQVSRGKKAGLALLIGTTSALMPLIDNEVLAQVPTDAATSVYYEK